MKNPCIKTTCCLLALLVGIIIGEGIKMLIHSPIPTIIAIAEFIRAFSPIIIGALTFAGGIAYERDRSTCRMYDTTHRPTNRFR